MKFRTIRRVVMNTKVTPGGFTLLEMLIILVLVGILSAIASPSWNSFYATRQLNVAQDQIQGAIKLGQHSAKTKHLPQRFVIEQQSGQVRWGIATDPNMPIEWMSAFKNITIDRTQTTFRKVKDKDQWFVVLDDDGTVTGQLGRVTLISPPLREQRCVVMATLLGETRKGKNQPVKRDGFTCY
jgi:prepilin-type N-terminal cleavage/methylation domain-containing protein